MSNLRWVERDGKMDKERFLKKIKKTADCWIWNGATTRYGHGRATYKHTVTTAHRVSWMLFVGPIPKGMYVCHKCDVPQCVNPKHLFLGTQKTNMADCVSKGRIARGESAGTVTLNNGSVLEIRKLFAEGLNKTQLAKKFGVERATIKHVVNRTTWGHI